MVLFSPVVPFPSYLAEKMGTLERTAPVDNPIKTFLVWGNRNRPTCTDARTKLVEPLGIDLAVGARQPLAHAFRQSRELDRRRRGGIGRIPAGAQPYARGLHLFAGLHPVGAANPLARLCDTLRVDLAILAAQTLLHPFGQLRDIGLALG